LSLASAFSVIIPARMASSRLPGKPLADLKGLPMVVRVAQRALQSNAQRVVVATDDKRIMSACVDHRIECVMTDAHHPSGSDRLAQAAQILGFKDEDIIVNVQGDEPLIEPSLINAVAQLLVLHPDCPMGTVAHEIESMADFLSPHVVKVVLNHKSQALYFSRASVPVWRDAPQVMPASEAHSSLPTPRPLRHVGLYAYRAQFLELYPKLSVSPLEQLEALEQLRVLWHGYPIAVHLTHRVGALGVDTPEDLERVRMALD
jgi:3-deoxy-manno-octulosonate cytidylyltransferase (CMP-KDO synthetase)